MWLKVLAIMLGAKRAEEGGHRRDPRAARNEHGMA
eukprot:CAMPEP_0205913418 /NCGR_PEP_ID=MMETSP1325-20131115/6524_1 /ASSEMBLY_ACC=CAM_ASM_000708 /TAXON_ID=236786 /ORGANISM="Florenciella sp., Strain RCC1007" /LENGTH=34 /DNA_ID= /DNA_START= /DNA_END= /DNA_ORIENTATION=